MLEETLASGGGGRGRATSGPRRGREILVDTVTLMSTCWKPPTTLGRHSPTESAAVDGQCRPRTGQNQHRSMSALVPVPPENTYSRSISDASWVLACALPDYWTFHHLLCICVGVGEEGAIKPPDYLGYWGLERETTRSPETDR